MKMVVISLIILLLMIGIWAWFYYGSVDPVTTYYWDSLIKLSDIVRKEDWERAKRDISIYTDKWYEVKKTWVFFINQEDLDNIDSSIRQLNIYIENEEKILAQAELEHLIVLFYVIDENECLTIENIF
ncbi:MAG: DUF4363 family protein [Tissierellia bacterium]|jgi:hypothetical protein|nr:DUF4363 family protein [Tissierellia bacterium]HOA20253.1 DUF4363 family protein [Sedimentibacter sp.]HOG63021.1 DUF4363 family protein [Sedimentibacter sp.]